ncbi:MAG: hypothetical protein JXR91_07160, partial [Deltaproteobacteria bacterium]|nr:hypothetical protein [Deltaproteobacteria bacterium]
KIIMMCLLMFVFSSCSKDSTPSDDESNRIIDNEDSDFDSDSDSTLLVDTDTMDDKCTIIEDIWEISEKTVFKKHNSQGPDYCIKNDLEFMEDLTIEPGVIVQFAPDVELKISAYGGSIHVNGTEENPIIFKGETDIPGSLKGINIESPDLTNIISHANIEHAGANKGSIIITNNAASTGIISLKHVNIENGASAGIWADDFDCDSKFINEMEDVTMSNLAGAPVEIPISGIGQLDPDSSYNNSNSIDAIVVSPNSIITSEICIPAGAVWKKINDGTQYIVHHESAIQCGMTIEKGVEISFESDAALSVEEDGYLEAIGTQSDPIVFTGTFQDAPSWRGIMFQSISFQNKIDYAQISYCGSSNLDSIFFKSITCIGLDNQISPGARLTITNSTISNSGGNGIETSTGSTLTQSDNVFENIAGDDII